MLTNYQLLEKYGSPLYVYDRRTLMERCGEMMQFTESLSKRLNVSIKAHYSTKSNANPAILREVYKAGLNVDCMSPFELAVDEKAGFTADRMLYVCNNISVEEMRLVHDKGILICLDSVSQVETWGKEFPGTEIMVRINPGTTGVGHSDKVITSGKATKFGISEANFPKLFEIAQKYDLKIVGVHQHLGSLFLNDKIPDYIAGVTAGLKLAKKYFKNLRIVDLGGGFGVPYYWEEELLDLQLLVDRLRSILIEYLCSDEGASVSEIKFEPGRFIPCEAGTLLGKVTAVKYENGVHWIGTDIGMNQLVRPSMYDAYHEIGIDYQDPKMESAYDEDWVTVNFCGNICESGDILGKNRKIPNIPKIGDIVHVYNSGAYGYSMASNYTGRPRPAEVLLDDGKDTLIGKRETIEDLMNHFVFE